MVKSFASVLTAAMALVCTAGLVVPATAGAAGRTLTVTTTADPDNGVGSCASGGSCSLREAVNQADAESGDQIVVPAGTYTLSSTFGPLTLTSDVTLAGAGASATTISGGDATQIIDVTSGTVTIAGATLTDGNNSSGDGGAAFVSAGASLTVSGDVVSNNHASGGGGGIADRGTLTVQSSTVSGNTTGTGIVAYGGGIEVRNSGSSATASIVDSTLSGNTGNGGGGLGLFNNQASGTATATVTRSAILSNHSEAYGGGVDEAGTDPASVQMSDSTIASNTAVDSGGGTEVGSVDTDAYTNDTFTGDTADGSGGEVSVSGSGSLTVENSIFAAGSAPIGANCTGTVMDAGHNLDDGASCGFSAPGDLPDTNPKLGPLQNNGGPTDTMALLPGSPAINAGSNTGCPATDQRGVPRPQQGSCDIGAYEVVPPPVSGSTPAAGTTPAVPHKFAFRRVKVRAKGLLVVPVVVPWAGKLSARATFTVRVRHHKRTFRYGATTAKAHKAGTVTLKVRLRGKAAKELRKIRHARVTITVTFAPTGGTRHTERHKVTVRRSRHGRYR